MTPCLLSTFSYRVLSGPLARRRCKELTIRIQLSGTQVITPDLAQLAYSHPCSQSPHTLRSHSGKKEGVETEHDQEQVSRHSTLGGVGGARRQGVTPSSSSLSPALASGPTPPGCRTGGPPGTGLGLTPAHSPLRP